jgi:hypothetical protein
MDFPDPDNLTRQRGLLTDLDFHDQRVLLPRLKDSG